jgi:hypothetical protein
VERQGTKQQQQQQQKEDKIKHIISVHLTMLMVFNLDRESDAVFAAIFSCFANYLEEFINQSIDCQFIDNLQL